MLEFEQKALSEKLNGQIKFGVDISLYSAIKIGGKVAAVIEPTNLKELKRAIRLLQELKLDYKVIGAASNLLFTHKNSQLIIVALSNLTGFKVNMKTQTVILGAGERLSACYAYTSKLGLSGFERLAGIPGTVGGAIVNNAGAFGVEIKDILESVTVLYPSGKLKTITVEELELSYRTSKLKGAAAIIVSACFKLKILAPSVIKSIATDCLLKRKETQPTALSLGSVFKKCGDIPAGKLIDELGFKGYTVGGCKVSEKHANFIINTGTGTAADFKKIVKDIQTKIKKEYNLDLELEVEYIES